MVPLFSLLQQRRTPPPTAGPERLGKRDGEVLLEGLGLGWGMKEAGSRGAALWWLGNSNIFILEAGRLTQGQSSQW